MRVCTGCGSEARPESKFCGSCGLLLPAVAAEPDLSLPDERRQLSFLFADLAGSTVLVQRLDPEDLLEINNSYHRAIVEAVGRYNGRISRFEGDGALALFGYPVAHEEGAVQAIRAGRAIVEAVRRIDAGVKAAFGVDIAVRIGIETGVVVVAAPVTESGRFEDTSFIGAPINMASRLQSLADLNGIVTGPNTRRIAGNAFTWRETGLHVLKGFTEPVQVYAVTGEAASGTRLERRLSQTRTPMIDRRDELAALLHAWELACAGRTQFVLVSGDAGIGKSRLLQTLREQTAASEPLVRLTMQCSSSLTNTALYPHIDMLRRMAGFADADDDARRLAKLRTLLQEQGLESSETLAVLASLLSITATDLPPLEMSGLLQRQRTFQSLINLLVNVARKAPVLLVYEDLHWLDQPSAELLALIAEDVRDARMLVIATTRPGTMVPWSDEPHVKQMPLARLNASDSREMVTALATEGNLSASTFEQIVARSDGVPLFVEELTRIVLDSSASDESGSVALPDTLLDLLNARLDAVGPARLVAQIGSVIGRAFPIRLVAEVAGTVVEALDASVERLVESGLVQPTSQAGVLVFKHALVQDAAYHSILARRRFELHGQIAEIVIARMPELAEAEPEIVARHLTSARQELQAAEWWVRAARQAIRRGAPPEAMAHFEAGLGALDRLPEGEARTRAELELLAGLGPTMMVMHGPGSHKFGEVQRRAFETTLRLPDRPAQFPITFGLALFHWGRAELREAAQLGEELAAIASREPTAEFVMAANTMNAEVSLHVGRPVDARDLLDHSTQLYQPDSHAELYPRYMMDFGVFGRFYLALASFVAGDPDAASLQAYEAASLASILGQPHSRGFGMLANFIVAAFRRDPAAALVWAEESLEFASEQGFPEFVALALIVRGWAQGELGEAAQGLVTLEEGIRLWHATGFENWQSWFAVLRAELLLRQANVSQALSVVSEQHGRVAVNGEELFKSLLVSTHARALALADSAAADEVERLHREAVAIAEAQQAWSWALRCALAYAAWLEEAGRIAQAQALLHEQLSRFDDHVVTGDTRDARDLLRRLTSAGS